MGGVILPSVGSMFKNIASVIESLTDNHQDPLHVGEAMACWTYLAYVSDVNGYIQAGLNTTTDPELQDLLYDGNKVTKSHQKEISDFKIGRASCRERVKSWVGAG